MVVSTSGRGWEAAESSHGQTHVSGIGLQVPGRMLGPVLYDELSCRIGRRTSWCCSLKRLEWPQSMRRDWFSPDRRLHTGTGIRINCISPGQIDVGIDLKGFDMRGMTAQLPPASLQSKEVRNSFPVLFP